MRIFSRSAVFTAAVLLFVLVTAANASNDRPLIYGMNPMPAEWSGHDGDQSWWEPLQYDKMQAAGCAAVRVGVGWDIVESTRGVYDWGDIDNDIKEYLDHGFEPIMLIVATPTWALLPGQGTPFYPAQLQYRQDFENFVYECARRFRGRVKYYEFWNEPNGYGWHVDQGYQLAWEYIPWLIHGYNAIKRGDPEALWSIGGMDDNGTGYADDYLRKFYYYMSKGYFDAVCEHPYSADLAQLWKLDDLRSVMASYGDDVPIWITELGWTANNREWTVAGWITDYFDRLSSDDYDFCKIATYHTATDFTAEPYGYGLMTYDLNTKPTYDAFSNHAKPARAVAGAPTVTNLDAGSVRIDYWTSMPATAQVMYGRTVAYGMVVPRETAASSSHSVTIKGLFPNTTYHYRIRAGAGEYADNFSPDYTFTTAAGPFVGVTVLPTASGVTTDSATITWSTNRLSDSKVEYSTDYSYSDSAYDPTPTYQHSVTLTGLQPNTAYQARIISTTSGYADACQETDTIVTKRTPGLFENGGFESYGPKQPWIIYGKNDGRVTGIWQGLGARSGNAFIGTLTSSSTSPGGYYQEVGAVPGTSYVMTAYTKSNQPNGTFPDGVARVGIDPSGGTDPYAASVIWGDWGASIDEWVEVGCMATAQSDKITIYVDINQLTADSYCAIGVDDVSIREAGDFMTLAAVKAADVGVQVSANGAVCTANFGDHLYVQTPERTNALRINFAGNAQPGDTVAFSGVTSFTGPEKSVDASVAWVEAPGSEPAPVALLVRDIGGEVLPGQTDIIPGEQGLNTLNSFVKICGTVTVSEEGYFYVDDGSANADTSGNAGIKVIIPEATYGPPVTFQTSVWGIAGAEEINGQWAPVLKQRNITDFEMYFAD